MMTSCPFLPPLVEGRRRPWQADPPPPPPGWGGLDILAIIATIASAATSAASKHLDPSPGWPRLIPEVVQPPLRMWGGHRQRGPPIWVAVVADLSKQEGVAVLLQ